MAQPLSTAASVAITFAVTLVLNTALTYYTSDRGAIAISKPTTIDSKAVTILSIENYSRDFVDNLAIEIPNSVPIDSLVSDTPVTITDSPEPHRGASRIVKVGQISPRLLTRIFIPVVNSNTASPIRVANMDASGLTLRKDDELESPIRKAIFSGLFNSLLYAMFAVALMYYANKRLKPIQDRLEEVTASSRKTHATVTALEVRLAKQRLLLLARVFDYSKELSFWRNAFRTLVLQSGGEKKRADDAIDAVTNSLKTYGTKSGDGHDFEVIRVASEWMARAEDEKLRSQDGDISQPLRFGTMSNPAP
jgi:hypothetical protein